MDNICEINVQTGKVFKKDLDSEDDKFAKVVCARLVSWHRKEVLSPEPFTVETGAELAKLNYEVALENVQLKDGTQVDPKIFRAVTVPEHGVVLGAVGKRHHNIQNRTVFNAIDRAVDGKAVIDVMGALGNGERCWVSTIPFKEFEIGKGDKVSAHLCWEWAHDGSGCLRARESLIREVCQNTLDASASGKKAGDEIRIMHTKSSQWKVPTMGETIARLAQHLGTLQEAFQHMRGKRVTREFLREFLRALIPADAESKKSVSMADRKRAELEDLFLWKSDGNGLAEDSRWGLYNAVTQWVDRERGVKDGKGKFDADTIRTVQSRLGTQTTRGIRQSAFDMLSTGDLKEQDNRLVTILN